MTWAVLATGPSLTQQDVDAVRGLKVVAVSDAYRLAPWADHLHSSDARWWKAHPEALKFAGTKSALETVSGVHCFQPSSEVLDERPSHLSHGKNSGYQGICIAERFGAQRILLLGFDMRRVGRTHFFGSHPRGLERAHPYADWLDRFAELAWALRGRVEVINCTPGSALKCFPRMGLQDALQEVRRTPEVA